MTYARSRNRAVVIVAILALIAGACGASTDSDTTTTIGAPTSTVDLDTLVDDDTIAVLAVIGVDGDELVGEVDPEYRDIALDVITDSVEELDRTMLHRNSASSRHTPRRSHSVSTFAMPSGTSADQRQAERAGVGARIGHIDLDLTRRPA